MRAQKGLWGPTLSAALAAGTFLALASPSRTQEVDAEVDEIEPEPGVETAAAAGTLRGVIREIDFSEGRVRVATEDADVWLRATPFDLVTLSPGDELTLRFATFDDERWLTPLFLDVVPRPAPGTPGGELGAWSSLTGVVRDVSVDRAMILVEDTPMYVHPGQLDDVTIGQLVSVTYVDLEDQVWAGTIEPVGPAGAGSTAGIGAENAVPGRPTEGRGSAAPTGADSFPRSSYPVPGFGSISDVDGGARGPIGVDLIPPEEVDDPAELEEQPGD